MPKRTTRKVKRRSTRRRRQHHKGGADDDIMFRDSDVCILKPGVKKGILVFTHYTQPAGIPSLCEGGIKTGAQLKKEGVDFGRAVFHPYLFFRAPYLSNPPDYTTVESEIKSSFGERVSDMPKMAWIRVDPDQTYVYSSEIRVKYYPQVRFGTAEYTSELESQVRNSRKTMTEYLRIIGENARMPVEAGKKPVYHLFSSEVKLIPMKGKAIYPWNEEPINMNSEVLVRIPHLTPDFFVKCTA